jgi:hypothetical protein
LLLKENFHFSKAVHKAAIGYGSLSRQQGEKEAGHFHSLACVCID